MREKDYTLGVDPEVQKETLRKLGYDTPEKIMEAYNRPFNIAMFVVPVEEVLGKKQEDETENEL
ncbi:hypothetical protein GH810_02805 [Acetobacterium paludosum]|uniref:Uncharacterized protein n=1 Tax=Acetobacterium paludosum TaxID=52693 RepID=A0A923KNL6_9FIRM|nr:hypothetical protein [Acetobacterium paludosum]MBC3887239.1 hypothetical protein [Acetobacterium paludosum]